MRNTEDDPLDGADIGETKTITETITLHGINMAPDVYYGNDRFCDDADIASVEIVETDGEDYNNIEVTWRGEATKQLPRRWDYHREPVTKEEQQTARRRKWIGRGVKAASFILPMGIATLLAVHVMNSISGDVTINGKPMVAPTAPGMLSVVAAVMFISAIIYIGFEKGGLPGKI